MATSHMEGTYNGGPTVIRAKRTGETHPTWGTACVQVLLGNESSTQPASGSGDPLEHPIAFTLDGEAGEVVLKTWGTQQDLDALVTAFKDAILDADGTIISG